MEMVEEGGWECHRFSLLIKVTANEEISAASCPELIREANTMIQSPELQLLLCNNF